MATLVDNLGIICLAVDSNDGTSMGRTKLQKMIYFSKYLNWDIDPYRLHFYGPYSNGVADSLTIAINNNIVHETIPQRGSYEYTLTETGNGFLNRFLTDVCDVGKVKRTRKLFAILADRTRDELELVATIDFVSNNTPTLNKEQLIQKVSIIKDNFSLKTIQNAYDIWQDDIQKEIKTLQK